MPGRADTENQLRIRAASIDTLLEFHMTFAVEWSGRTSWNASGPVVGLCKQALYSFHADLLSQV